MSQQQFPSFDFIAPVGRLVSGSLTTASDRGYNGAKREKPQYFFAVAIPQNDPNIGRLLEQIQTHTWQSYGATPHAQAVHARITAGPIGSSFPPPQESPFAWKIENGSSPEHAGKDGWNGCWVLKFSGTFPINCADAQNQQINPATVQLGSYVQVAGSTTINGQGDRTAGIFLNYRFVRVIAPADGVNIPIIVPGPSAAQVFGDAGYSGPMPAGAAAPGVPPAYQQPPAGAPPVPGYGAAPGNTLATPQPGVYTPGPAPYTPPRPPADVPVVPAGAVPVPGAPPAPTGYPAAQPTAPAAYAGTAYPSNPPGAVPGVSQAPQYHGVQPHHAFVTPAPGVTQQTAPGTPPAPTSR